MIRRDSRSDAWNCARIGTTSYSLSAISLLLVNVNRNSTMLVRMRGSATFGGGFGTAGEAQRNDR